MGTGRYSVVAGQNLITWNFSGLLMLGLAKGCGGPALAAGGNTVGVLKGRRKSPGEKNNNAMTGHPLWPDLRRGRFLRRVLFSTSWNRDGETGDADVAHDMIWTWTKESRSPDSTESRGARSRKGERAGGGKEGSRLALGGKSTVHVFDDFCRFSTGAGLGRCREFRSGSTRAGLVEPRGACGLMVAGRCRPNASTTTLKAPRMRRSGGAIFSGYKPNKPEGTLPPKQGGG